MQTLAETLAADANAAQELADTSSKEKISAKAKMQEAITEANEAKAKAQSLEAAAQVAASAEEQGDAVKVTADGAIQTSLLQEDDSFASPAANKVASSESIKAYTDAQIAALPTGVSLGLVLALS